MNTYTAVPSDDIIPTIGALSQKLDPISGVTSTSERADVIASFQLFAAAQVDFIVETLSQAAYSPSYLRYQLFLLAKNMGDMYTLEQKRYFYERACDLLFKASLVPSVSEGWFPEEEEVPDYSDWNTNMSVFQITLLLDALEHTSPIPGERPETQTAALGRFRAISDETLENFLAYVSCSHYYWLAVSLVHDLNKNNIDTEALIVALKKKQHVSIHPEMESMCSTFLAILEG